MDNKTIGNHLVSIIAVNGNLNPEQTRNIARTTGLSDAEVASLAAVVADDGVVDNAELRILSTKLKAIAKPIGDKALKLYQAGAKLLDAREYIRCHADRWPALKSTDEPVCWMTLEGVTREEISLEAGAKDELVSLAKQGLDIYPTLLKFLSPNQHTKKVDPDRLSALVFKVLPKLARADALTKDQAYSLSYKLRYVLNSAQFNEDQEIVTLATRGLALLATIDPTINVDATGWMDPPQ